MRNTPWILLACLGLPISAYEPPSRPGGKPEKISDFKWADPFSSPTINNFQPSCEAEKAFEASEFLLDDLSEVPPLGLLPFSEALKTIFSGRPYPGSWNGIDPHGYDRNLLMMEYADVPIKVREWIEAQEAGDGEGKGLFAVYDKPADVEQPVKSTVKFSREGGANLGIRPLDQNRVVLFAPGALYDVLPLWVAETSDCEDTLLDLAKYSADVSGGNVVAWLTKFTRADRKAQKRDIVFTVKAQVVGATKGDDAEASPSVKDEL